MRASGLIFVAVVLIVAVATHRMTRLTARRPVQPPQSDAAPSDHPSTLDNLVLQAECLQQGRALYRELGYPKGRIAGFGTHYNEKLGKCFLDITHIETATPPAVWMHRRVLDAATAREYAGYSALVPNKDSAPDAPVRCELRLLSGERRSCRSGEEFADLAAAYMEEQ